MKTSKADKYFSLYIRIRDCDEEIYNVKITITRIS